jgi:hypothetical protein
MKQITILLLIALFAVCAYVGVSFGQTESRQYLMADQHGNIMPSGYAAGLSDIARAEATAAILEQSVAISAQTMVAGSNLVDGVVQALTGAFGFCYATGHTISFAGAVQVSQDAAAYIAFINLGAAGTMTTNGVQHTGHYAWHYYTAAMNTTPLIKYRRVLNSTNSWEFVPLQSTAQYNNETVNGITYETIYRSTVWLPSVYDSAFFMAFCEILPGGSAGGALDIVGSLTIGGQALFSGTVTNSGLIRVYSSGLLMGVTAQ